MAYIDLNAVNFITRDPLTMKGSAVFAINFDDLQVKLDGKEIPISDVCTIFHNMGVVDLFVKDGDEIQSTDDMTPMTKAVEGKLELIGKPEACGCSMAQFKVPQWWKVKRTRQ